MSLPAKVRSIKAVEPDLYHGIPVLTLKVGDPIPTPRAPERYAVRIYPDLARYLLTFNPENNRSLRKRTVAKYAGDMRAGLWWFTPESVVFSRVGLLQNGQHRLLAVCEYGSDVWMTVDFGWDEGIISAIDRGNARTNADALHVNDVPNAAMLAGAITTLVKYEDAVGTTRQYSSAIVVSAQQAKVRYDQDPDGWQDAVRNGRRVYDHLDKGLSPSTWVAAYRVIDHARPGKAEPFFAAVADGSDPAGSASRALADWARRRPVGRVETGDKREPMERIIRAFNAWQAGKSVSFPRVPGFTLSRVK